MRNGNRVDGGWGVGLHLTLELRHLGHGTLREGFGIVLDIGSGSWCEVISFTYIVCIFRWARTVRSSCFAARIDQIKPEHTKTMGCY